MKEKIIKLPPADCSNSYGDDNVYKEYRTLRRKSGDFDKWLRRRYAQQDAKCFYCECSLKNKRINVDHVIPISKGGTNRSTNLVIACAQCNKEKNANLPNKKFVNSRNNRIKSRIKKQARDYKAQQIHDQETYTWIDSWA